MVAIEEESKQVLDIILDGSLNEWNPAKQSDTLFAHKKVSNPQRVLNRRRGREGVSEVGG